MCYYVLSFLSLVSVIIGAMSVNVSSSVKFAVINDLRKFFNLDCLVFVTTDRFEQDGLVKELEKEFSALYVTTRTHSAFLALTNRRYNRELGVILVETDQEARFTLALVSPAPSFSDTPWIVLSPAYYNASTPENATLFHNVNIPFNCVFLVAETRPDAAIRLTEFYRVAQHLPLESNAFGYWTAKKGLLGPQQGLYSRRNSLLGMTMDAVVFNDPPSSIVDVTKESPVLEGFCGKVWSILELNMNFRTSLVPSAIRGGATSNGSWNGLVGMIARKQAHLSASTIPMTLERVGVVDFSFPLNVIYYRIYLRNPEDAKVGWDNFLSPMRPSLWLALIVSSAVTALVMTFINYCIRRFGGLGTEETYSFGRSLFLVFSAVICQQGHEGTPKSSTCRIVFMMVYVTGIVAINGYSASLISTLTAASKVPLPFNDLQQLANQETYTLGVFDQSLIHAIFMRSKEDVLKKLFVSKTVEPYLNPKTSKHVDAIEEVCSRNFAFIDAADIVAAIDGEISCRVTSLPEHFVQNSASLVFPKGSAYRGIFNHNLLKLIESGVLKELYKSTLRVKTFNKDPGIRNIGIEDVKSVLCLLAAGLLLAVLLVAGERTRVNLAARDQVIRRK